MIFPSEKISQDRWFSVRNYASWYLKCSVESRELCKLRLRGLIWYALEFNENCPAALFFISLSLHFASFFPLIIFWFFAKAISTMVRKRAHFGFTEFHMSWHCCLYAQWSVERKSMQCVQCAQTCRFQKLKSQTVWRIWCFVWCVSFGLLFFFHVLAFAGCRCCFCCCCW